MKVYIFSLVLILIYAGCAKPPDLDEVPSLEYIGLSKYTMKQGSVNQDSVIITLKVKDGDGDIGFIPNGTPIEDLFIIDKRTDNLADTYIIPSIPPQGANNGVIITMDVVFRTLCCRENSCDPDPEQPDELLPLEIYVQDRAGNQSNRVEINDLTLICKK